MLGGAGWGEALGGGGRSDSGGGGGGDGGGEDATCGGDDSQYNPPVMPSCMQPVCQVAGESHAVRPLGTYGVPKPLAHAAVRHEHRPELGGLLG